MSIHYSLYKARNIKKAMVITGQTTTEILFKYILYTNNKNALGILLVNNFADELLV